MGPTIDELIAAMRSARATYLQDLDSENNIRLLITTAQTEKENQQTALTAQQAVTAPDHAAYLTCLQALDAAMQNDITNLQSGVKATS